MVTKPKGKAAPKKAPAELRDIRNKQKRQEVFRKRLEEKKKEKKEEKKKAKKLEKETGQKAPPKQPQRTLENAREVDETMVDPNDEEVLQDEETDQFADYFKGREPKMLITTGREASGKVFQFIREFKQMFPFGQFYKRRGYMLPQIFEFAKNRKFTDVVVIHERKKRPVSLMITHLPNGPTAFFKLSGVVMGKELPNRGEPSPHRPELILNGFNTRLGHTIGRMFAALLPHDPQFKGRQVITFHNQRDFIFVRFHRYIFNDAKDVDLQELGPRFTMKLQWIQKGLYDLDNGEYEWHHKNEMDTSRKRFFL